MRYRWPEGKQSAAVLSFDVDAESGFLFREPERAKRSLADLEERRFGPRVGVDRILRLVDRLKLRARFCIPPWTVEHHPAPSKRIRNAHGEWLFRPDVSSPCEEVARWHARGPAGRPV